MLMTQRTTIEGQKCKLVPYLKEHVPTYNKWLNDPYIQQMTQTEPYSLSQEYEYVEYVAQCMYHAVGTEIV